MMYYLFEKLGVEKSAINLPRVRFHKFKTRMATSIHTNHLGKYNLKSRETLLLIF